jgi:hypothetical protein
VEGGAFRDRRTKVNTRVQLCQMTLLASILFFGEALCLEKTVARLPDLDRDIEWRSNTESCSIVYYNACTGWIWVWSSWAPEDRVGVNFDTCCPTSNNSNLLTGWMFVQSGSPPGYGFTGTVDVWVADAQGCPIGSPLASTVILPVLGWNKIDYQPTGGVQVPASFTFTYTLGPGAGNPLAFASDHPAAGPTGPAACGTCYPTTRTTQSFYFGSSSSPLCPGSSFNDGLCNAELIWDAQLNCIPPISVEPSTWTEIKELYR